MKKFLVALVMMVAMFGAINCHAGDPIEKLGRGIANVAFGPLELLINPYDVNQEQGAIASLTYGVVKGVVWTVVREVVGVAEIVTFFMPLPGCTDDPDDSGWGYGPIVRPAWVVDIDHNAYNFFYDESPLVDPSK